jgi:hypothetical protein
MVNINQVNSSVKYMFIKSLTINFFPIKSISLEQTMFLLRLKLHRMAPTPQCPPWQNLLTVE